ncbi:MAG: bifunctional pyr operon transcriptional regulator/uracil phosphoribosyltransferase PyrR [Verrucomicrobiae bacterium]|nr:bifunctional pyr operon transcriptional regulator/uracil phosphoribosyltransferase PyrR [Verrucomicrobiae bacterium]
MPGETTMMDAKAIDRALSRMAHEIAEQTEKVALLAFVGIHSRGVPLAHRLASRMEAFTGVKIPVGALDITLHRDDLRNRVIIPKIQPTHIPFDVSGRHVVLIDDVLFTGRSFQAALNALLDFGRCARIRIAVLVDRGHRELPLKADFVGKNVPTSPEQKVVVRLREIDGEDGATLITPPATPTQTVSAP